jgi:hypothetical protein
MWPQSFKDFQRQSVLVVRWPNPIQEQEPERSIDKGAWHPYDQNSFRRVFSRSVEKAMIRPW